ncbi:MAG: lasso peptide biosynthesis B2 protein [Pseudomonadota bacterium]
MRKLKQFAALSWWQQGIFLESWLRLGLMRAAVLTRPMKSLTRQLKHHEGPLVVKPASPEQQRVASNVGKLVAAAAKYTPWDSPCLVQVLVVQRLMAKRQIPGQFYLGVRKGREFSDSGTDLSAHAWLQCGQMIVSGEAGHQLFTVVSAFSWEGRETPK